MYLEHFQLKEEPFRLTPNPHYLYLSNKHAKAKTYLDFAIWNRDGFAVITGEIGSGKTTVLNKVLEDVDKDVIVCKIHHTLLNEIELIKAVLLNLGIQVDGNDKVEMINVLTEFLLEQYLEGRRVLLVIDEAQNLSPKALEELRLMSGLEYEYEKLINIILVGQPELKILLESKPLEQLTQRIRLKFHLRPLTEEETVEYIHYRLETAGAADTEIFPMGLMPIIYRYTGGIPRLINILCDTALIIAFAEGKTKIDREILKEAIKELQWVTYKRRKAKLRKPREEQRRKHETSPHLGKFDGLPLDIDLATITEENNETSEEKPE